jgi:hypothetical protein
MKKKTFLVILLFSVLVQTTGGRAQLTDSANLVANPGAIEKEIRELYLEHGVLLEIVTEESVGNIDDFAEGLFFEKKLDVRGVPNLNLLVVYSKRENRLRIAHSDRCSLSTEAVLETERSESVSGEIAKGNYGEAFFNLVSALKREIIKEAEKADYCPSPPAIELNADPGIFEPPTRENPYGKSLDRELNPYDDGIVTVFDPLACTLRIPEETGSVSYRVAGSRSGSIESGTIHCKNFECVARIPPGKARRGEEIECKMVYKDKEYSGRVTVARYVYIFVPVNQERLGNMKEQYEYFVRLSEVGDSTALEGKALYFRGLYGDYENIYTAAERVPKDVQNKLKAGFDPGKGDRVIIIIDDKSFYPMGSFAASAELGGSSVVMPGSRPLHVLSHELGHSVSGLCDEYTLHLWKKQNALATENGCPNPFPDCCKNECQKRGGLCASSCGLLNLSVVGEGLCGNSDWECCETECSSTSPCPQGYVCEKIYGKCYPEEFKEPLECGGTDESCYFSYNSNSCIDCTKTGGMCYYDPESHTIFCTPTEELKRISEGGCGNIYDCKGMPEPDYPGGPGFSIMGDSPRPVYPREATCPLRNC